MLDNLNEPSDTTGSESEDLDETTENEDLDDTTGTGNGEGEEEDEGVEVIEIDGDEYTLDQIREMKGSGLRQSDYTRKTQALANERSQVTALSDTLASTIKALEGMIGEEESADDLDELLNDDPSEYIRRQNRIKAKKGKLQEAKDSQSNALRLKQAEESQKLVLAMDGWADSTKGQDVQKRDLEAGLKYAGKLGFSNEELNSIADHRVLKAIIDAGKFSEAKDKKPALKKRKIITTKKTSKNKAPAGQEGEKTLGQLLYGSP